MRPSSSTSPATLKGEPGWFRGGRSTAILVVSLCLGVASGATAYRVLARRSGQSRGGLRRGPLFAPGTYRLSALRVFSDVLQRVRDTYVDPSRIHPHEMLLAGLEALQEQVPEVLVHLRDDGQRARLQVGAYVWSFDISDVRSLHTLYQKMKAVVSFVERHLGRKEDLHAIEYACINGVLSTLDPHSVLWDPQTYREMKVGTRGAFGGLGIVISIRKGVLTVISPIDGTPAAKAGVRAGDRIVRIGSESTVNMTLTEAVNRLRGEPGTKVVLYVERTGEPAPIRFEIARAVIKWKTVESRMLDGRIGYVRIKHFSRTTARDLGEHLRRLARKHMVGLVVDLYDNPGGLLDQAVKVADLFLSKGVIVTTVGNAGTQREERRATPDSPVAGLPLAVLVNGGSASASEIVAGALKNLDRAVVIGETTFGKGSVQVLYDNWDGSALKLTIAQYLTPGNVSIQSVGISPDIRMLPVRVAADRILFYAADRRRRERDLAAHLDADRHPDWMRPVATVRYLEASTKGDATKDPEDEGGGADPAVVRLARDLLAQRFGRRRRRVLRLSREFLSARRAAEERRIELALRARGIDWSVEPPSSVPMLEASVDTADKRRVYQAGDTVRIRVTVTNLGVGAAYRVRAISDSSRPALQDREFFLGRVAPAESRKYEVPVQIPRGARSGIWRVRLRFFEEYGHAPPSHLLRIRIQGHPRPLFAARLKVLDLPPGGNGDGLLQWGESVRLAVWGRNLGRGESMHAVAVLKNQGGPAVFLHRGYGRANLGVIGPGEERKGVFLFDLRRTPGVEAARLLLRIVDEGDPQSEVSREVHLPILPRRRPVETETGWVTVKGKNVLLRSGADGRAFPVAEVTAFVPLQVMGRAGGFYRVRAPSVGTAFVSVDQVGPLKSRPPPSRWGSVRPTYQVTPPLVALGRYPLSTTASEVDISATAVDDRRVVDAYVLVRYSKGTPRMRKVAYVANGSGVDPATLWLRARVALRLGVNAITVVARDGEGVRSERTVEILREEPAAHGLAVLRARSVP